MEKLEQRIIEIRENINFLDEKMNKMYSAYEIARDKKEDAEVNLEILNSQKKDLSSKMLNKQISKVSLVLMPLILCLFGYICVLKVHFTSEELISNILLIIAGVFLCLLLGYLLSYAITKFLVYFTSSKLLFANLDDDILKINKEIKVINKKIRMTSKMLKEYKVNEKDCVEKYTSLCGKYNLSKKTLDEVENLYFDKTKSIISELKTYNLYNLIMSLSDEEKIKFINNIETIIIKK